MESYFSSLTSTTGFQMIFFRNYFVRVNDDYLQIIQVSCKLYENLKMLRLLIYAHLDTKATKSRMLSTLFES